MGKLTVKKVEALTAAGRYSDGDGSGFHLRIDQQGRKYYILRLIGGAGKRRDVNIGSAKQMTLSAAREKARQRRDEVAESGSAVETPDFEKAAKLAHAARTAGYRNPKHVVQWLSTLETHAYPKIGSKRIDEVTRADVVDVLMPIWLSTPETARRVLQRIDRVMRWAVGNNHREKRIDMDLVRDALPRQPKRRATVRRMPSVPWQEVTEFWFSIALSPSAPEIRLALSFLILTASRPGNVRLAKRDQFDLEAATWSIPGAEMKTGEPHRVPLSAEAVRIVRTAMAMHNHQVVFTMAGRELSIDTMRMMMRRMGNTETPHGFRSTFKEWARASGWEDELSELALAHLDSNEVRAAYARDDRLEARRPMMQAWAAYLAGKQPTPAATAPEQASAART